jgi:hypothetical protein
MTFLASACSKTLLKLQKSQYEYQQILITFRINAISKESEAIERRYNNEENGTQALENDEYYQQLRRISENFDTEKDSIDSQISLLDAEIKSLETMTNNGIKSSCSLTLNGG